MTLLHTLSLLGRPTQAPVLIPPTHFLPSLPLLQRFPLIAATTTSTSPQCCGLLMMPTAKANRAGTAFCYPLPPSSTTSARPVPRIGVLVEALNAALTRAGLTGNGQTISPVTLFPTTSPSAPTQVWDPAEALIPAPVRTRKGTLVAA
jgi:hypothetical protein